MVVSMTVHGAVPPDGVVFVCVHWQPIGAPLFFLPTTVTSVVALTVTPLTRDATGSDFAGYVAVILATSPAEPGHAHALHMLAPS